MVQRRKSEDLRVDYFAGLLDSQTGVVGGLPRNVCWVWDLRDKGMSRKEGWRRKWLIL